MFKVLAYTCASLSFSLTVNCRTIPSVDRDKPCDDELAFVKYNDSYWEFGLGHHGVTSDK